MNHVAKHEHIIRDKHHHKKKHEEINIFVGARIKAVRIAMGFTKLHVSKMVGITYQQLTNYESAKSSITIERLYKLSKVFNSPITTFLPNQRDLFSMRA